MKAVSSQLAHSQPASVDEKTAIQVEALKRLKDVDLDSNSAIKGALERVLEKTRGTPQYVELVREFKLKDRAHDLLDYALSYPAETSGIDAFRFAISELGRPAIEKVMSGPQAAAAIRLIGNSNDRQLQSMLHPLVSDASKPIDVRKEAVRALAHSRDGARFLLDQARKDELPQDVKLTAASELNLAPWGSVKKAAAEVLPLPKSNNAEPLPPISVLIKRTGNAAHGRQVFESPLSACSTCHRVNGKGNDVGPNLSEIGTKLGKDAIYESILDPSAGIAFGFEPWTVELKNGDEAYGIIVNETPDEIAIKNQTGAITKYKKDEIAKRQKMTTSIMPTGLQLTMSTQDLVDLVEYLSSLRKVEPSK
jgi:putative heme-binding domain-containing protein